MRIFSNNASTTLATGIDDTDTSIVVSNSNGAISKFPTPSTGNKVYLTIQSASDGGYEIVELLSINAGTNTLNVRRGNNFAADDPDKTASRGFITGDRIECRLTAGALEGMVQRDADEFHGGVFGSSPAAPDTGSSTLIVKHTQQPGATPVLALGEMALDLRRGVLWAGLADGAGALNIRHLFSGMFVQSAEPTNYGPSTLWFDTTPEVMALKIRENTQWKQVVGLGQLATGLLLKNNHALKSRNADDDDEVYLIRLFTDDSIYIGELDWEVTRIRTNWTEVLNKLVIKTRDLVDGEWELNATSVFGAPALVLTPSKNNSAVAVKVKSSGGVERQTTFQADGRLTLSGVTPTAVEDATSKGYVDTAVAEKGALCRGRVNAAGGVVGTATGWSVSKGGTGQYTINLSPGVANANRMTVVATATDGFAGFADICVVGVTVNTASQFAVSICTMGGAASNRGFSFAVFDNGV